MARIVASACAILLLVAGCNDQPQAPGIAPKDAVSTCAKNAPAPKAVECDSPTPNPSMEQRSLQNPEQIGTTYADAEAAEAKGDIMAAIRLYRRLARAGDGKAAVRLGKIYEEGRPGVQRDLAEADSWYDTARQLGMSIESRR